MASSNATTALAVIASAAPEAASAKHLSQWRARRSNQNNIQRRLVQEAIDKVQEHWSARHAIHVWDRLELSRSQMETLRHLLSFVYAYSTDKYAPIKVWQNPNDPSDYVSCPQLAARPAREKLYAQLCDESEIEVRENGRCERDAIKVTSSLYCNYALAMRTDFTSQRPARPIWFVDGTGGSLGRGVCHAEIGSADFTRDCYQSRATLGPLALYSGNDHAAPLRENLQTAAAGFNKLILAGEIKLRDGGRIPAEPILVADLQGVKCMAGQTESCHAVHCKCAKGDKQHKLPDGQFRTFEEVDAWISSNGCEFREFDWMCASAHFSPGVARGGRYTAFACPHCDYSPSTEARWRADYKEFVALTDEEQAERRRAHVANAAHAHQELYMPPLLYLDMTHAGVDNLHLVYLNLFKHLFKYTVHEPLPDSKKKLVREYLKSQGYYSYAADADEDDPVKRWIGREVKRFLHEAHLHLPFLLQLAAAPLDVCGARASDLDADGREAMDADDEFDPTSEELQAEAEAEPEMMSNADKWDHFLALVRLVESKWDRDDDDYRKLRAVSWFNQMAICYADLMQLKPTMQSWVPHIALNIVTRQMVILGDPMRRSADACESYGAVVKKFIKHLTCRRTIKEEQSNHTRVTSLGNKVIWKQHFRKGFIQQAFSRLCVREGILHGESNQPFLQRADERQKHSGLRGSKIEKEECEPSPTVREHMLREADRA
ncbi:hypothetical protein AB1Y20_022293 [Prymnesium parvum]|uniref:CxC2-like cysteine cluster KDZ transposase-associated domain-containing protein n=2 Tax=Prymnesium parvum TaxID=97485 RepID=A0AB34JFH0_PRYPA